MKRQRRSPEEKLQAKLTEVIAALDAWKHPPSTADDAPDSQDATTEEAPRLCSTCHGAGMVALDNDSDEGIWCTTCGGSGRAE